MVLFAPYHNYYIPQILVKFLVNFVCIKIFRFYSSCTINCFPILVTCMKPNNEKCIVCSFRSNQCNLTRHHGNKAVIFGSRVQQQQRLQSNSTFLGWWPLLWLTALHTCNDRLQFRRVQTQITSLWSNCQLLMQFLVKICLISGQSYQYSVERAPEAEYICQRTNKLATCHFRGSETIWSLLLITDSLSWHCKTRIHEIHLSMQHTKASKAQPKSHKRYLEFSSSYTMLLGFTSQWTTPAACTACNAYRKINWTA